MTKLDMAVYWDGENGVKASQSWGISWNVWSMPHGPNRNLSEDQDAYEQELSDKSTMVLRGVTLDVSHAIESIDSVEFDTFASIADYPEEFITWIESITNIKPVFKPGTIEDNYHPVTKPAGYQLDSGKELKDVYPELLGKEATVAGYKQIVIKYLMRYQDKNGEEDLDKAIQYIGFIKELEYGGAK
ncbi:hypothetical protein WS105_0637 [Weissella ceti]|uniref:DUF3310 domain-containing protein n=1 Tax=Weissella ceti TaxID=759620 RepID=UPI0004F64480|nr:DUF3310 domain-containing protein [Weissella ceti]AIM64227.1 hypothetical protein WS105_0637 [Weissella ceti]